MSTPVEIPRSIKEAAEKYAVETDGAFQYAVDWSEVSQIYQAGAQLVLERLVRARERFKEVMDFDGCLRGCQCGCVNQLNWTAEKAIEEIDSFLEGK